MKRRTMKIIIAGILAFSFCAFAVDKDKEKEKEKPKAPTPSQPAVETLDLETIARIRDEGMNHSHIMEYAGGLFDGIGSRLTGSPDFAKAQEWSLEQFRRMGAANVHAESWGEFGMGWQQIGTSALMTAPGTATLLAQATPWSPATAGEVTADVIAVPDLRQEKDFEAWKGKLAGKIILYGDAPKINPDLSTLLVHYDPA
jgi:carboxypeptidase Q